MGTRATIRINGKLMMATHWDGYPDSLGADLAKLRNARMLSTKNIIRVCGEHHIDFADTSVIKMVMHANLAHLIEDQKEDPKDFRKVAILNQKRQLQGKPINSYNIMSADDYGVSPMRQYNDFAEFEYDVNTARGTIKCTPLTYNYNRGDAGYRNRRRGRSIYL